MSLPPHTPTSSHHRTGKRALSGALLVIGASLVASALAAARSVGQPHYVVTGSAFADGQAPVGAKVALHPLNPDDWVYLAPQGVVDETGAFEIKSVGSRAGAPAGDYAVTIVWTPLTVSGEDIAPANNILPADYARPDSTPLRVTIARRENRLPPMELNCHCRDRLGIYFYRPSLAAGRL